MKHIAFYIANKNITSVDCRNLLAANPGIGGSEYLILLAATLLSKHDNDIKVTLYVQEDFLYKLDVHTEIAENLSHAVTLAGNSNIDYLSFMYHPLYKKNDKQAYLSCKNGLKLLPYCHNFARFKDLDFFADNDSVQQIITVGREQKDIYRDHRSFKKTSYIYNCVNTDCINKYDVKSHPFSKRGNIVTYIGSLSPMKSFHCLAKAWPKVVKEIPDAQLFVIGSGTLYSRNEKLGKWGLAESHYEEYFVKYLSRNGEILSNVHFMGVLGDEKNEILLKTKVGVPNPIGSGETFCLSAVEMQLMGAKVVACKACGYMDTFKNGIFANSKQDLAKTIIRALKTNKSQYDNALSYIQKNFSQQHFLADWESLIKKGYIEQDNSLVHPNYRMKYIKESLRKLKNKYSLLNRIPSIESLKSYVEKRIIERFIYKFHIKYYDRFDFVN